MTKKLQHIFALSEKGAKDLVKAVIWCFVCNLALMFPVGAVLFTVQHLLSCLEGGGSPMDGFWLYVGFALAVLLFCCSSSTGSSTPPSTSPPTGRAPTAG